MNCCCSWGFNPVWLWFPRREGSHAFHAQVNVRRCSESSHCRTGKMKQWGDLLSIAKRSKPFWRAATSDVLFAIDGTLCRYAVKGRRNDFYCRKEYACINVQVTGTRIWYTWIPTIRGKRKITICSWDRLSSDCLRAPIPQGLIVISLLKGMQTAEA